MLKVEIDPGSGFCGGVIRAITRAEDFLSREDRLYSLGAIVHNDAELGRLQQLGLVTVNSLEEVPEGGTVLIRAHGEPPSTYESALKRQLSVIDCSCPVVLQLQRRIREAFRLQKSLLLDNQSRRYDILFTYIAPDVLPYEDIRAAVETILGEIRSWRP